MNPLLITGGNGMLGQALREICQGAIFISNRDCDLRDLQSVQKLLKELRPQAILHLAADVGGVKKNAEKNADLLTNNVQINTNLLSTAAFLGCPRVISVLSSCAFATYPDKSSTEQDLHIGLPYAGNLGYATSKRVLDIQTKLLSKQYGLCYSTLTPVTMYGPYDNFDLEDGHVISSLIRKTIEAKKNAGTLEVWGTGEIIRQFVYVKDIARLLLKALDCYQSQETLIVAPDKGVSIRALAQTITKVIGFEGAVSFDTTKPEGQKYKTLQSQHWPEYFKDFPFTSLEQGIRETVDWLSSNPKNIFL